MKGSYHFGAHLVGPKDPQFIPTAYITRVDLQTLQLGATSSKLAERRNIALGVFVSAAASLASFIASEASHVFVDGAAVALLVSGVLTFVFHKMSKGATEHPAYVEVVRRLEADFNNFSGPVQAAATPSMTGGGPQTPTLP